MEILSQQVAFEKRFPTLVLGFFTGNAGKRAADMFQATPRANRI